MNLFLIKGCESIFILFTDKYILLTLILWEGSILLFFICVEVINQIER
jgi:hypothetical protein